MDYEVRDCIDAGSEFCPCHLADMGECILCSQLSGKKFCDCINWKGVCIYQEYIWNSEKVKDVRKNYTCKIINKTLINEKILIFTILIPHTLAKNLIHPGSFVFIRKPDDSNFFDTPISIMECNTEDNLIKIVIEIKGIKTKAVNILNEGENIIVRGPFWNGILGIKNIYSSKEETSILIARGIGQAPMVPVMKKLYANGNKIVAIVDKSPYKEVFISPYLEMCNSTVIQCKTIDHGELTEDLKNIISDLMAKEKINLIHCAGPDILSSKVINQYKNDTNISCCNNSKMCCGEGICGACVTRYKGQRTKRLCKVQIDPKYIFEERRFI